MIHPQDAEKNITSSQPVKLQPLFHIPPIIYIPILFASILLLIVLFFLDFFSALISPGSYIKITSVPANASVTINGIYYGTSPLQTQLKKGTYTVLITTPHFTRKTQTVTIKNKYLLRKKQWRILSLHQELTLTNPEAFIAQQTETIASWAMVRKSKLQYTTPTLLENSLLSLESLISHYKTNSAQEAKEQTLLLQNTQKKLLDTALPYHNTIKLEPNFTSHFISQQAQKVANIAAYHALSTTQTHSPITITPKKTNTTVSSTSLRIHGITFMPVQTNKIKYGLQYVPNATGEFQVFTETSEALQLVKKNKKADSMLLVTVPAFYIMQNEVSQKQFQVFLEENNWNGIEKIANDYKDAYLQNFTPHQHPHSPVRGVSYYDALAFAQWLNSYSTSLGFIAVLPNEYQWMSAAQQYRQASYIFNVNETVLHSTHARRESDSHFLGSLWEFTNTWHSPLPQFADFEGPHYGSEKIILGGSFINKNKTAFTRGVEQNIIMSRNNSMPVDWVSPYVGFRIALVPMK